MTSYLSENAGAATACPECAGIGLIRKQDAVGNWYSTACPCQLPARIRGEISRAGFPGVFRDATLLNFQRTESNDGPRYMANRYLEEFIPGPRGPQGVGLLFHGPVGTGKTHLAVAIARELIETRGISARFFTIADLLARLRATYSKADGSESESEVLKQVFAADLVVIDELGAVRATDWAFEMQELILGWLYNHARPLLVTTNLANLGAGESSKGVSEYARAAAPETLGDRIGARMFSRLQQMCIPVAFTGIDWRRRR